MIVREELTLNRFAYYSEDPQQVVLYVQSILPFISDISHFELHHFEKTPFVETIEKNVQLHRRVYYNRKEFEVRKKSYRKQIRQLAYTFFLRDDSLNEIWLNTNGKMIETVKILHMLGIKEFHPYRDKDEYIADGLKPNHDLNILVVDDYENKLFLAKYRFPYACKRLKAIETIQQYGYLKPYTNKFDYGEDLAFFDVESIREAETYEYATNNALLFEEDNTSLNMAIDIIEEVAKVSGGDVEIQRLDI